MDKLGAEDVTLQPIECAMHDIGYVHTLPLADFTNGRLVGAAELLNSPEGMREWRRARSGAGGSPDTR
jgi:hypothetical protein